MNENAEIKKIAFVVNNEVFYTMYIPQVPDFAGVYEGMLSNPTPVDISDIDIPIEPGMVYLNGEFYIPLSKIYREDPETPEYEVE